MPFSCTSVVYRRTECIDCKIINHKMIDFASDDVFVEIQRILKLNKEIE